MRSLLFVPADQERKLIKALASTADALILDCEDAVTDDRKDTARHQAAAFLREARGNPQSPLIFVRVNGLNSGLIEQDLDLIMPQKPDGIVLPKIKSNSDISHLGNKLAVREALYNVKMNSTLIIAVTTETPQGVLSLTQFNNKNKRLKALTWASEDLALSVNATSNRDEAGHYTPLFQLARSLTLLAAAQREVPALDAIYAAFRDEKGLQQECAAALRDGFSGKMAIHPDQVPTINEAFTPSSQETERARAIVDAFAAQPEAGTIRFEGEMLDRPHLTRALHLLQRGKITVRSP
jgi:citrate lyase subunit beta / citryl-CoA lyase